MNNYPFIAELTEARQFFDAKDVKGRSPDDIASIVFLMIMTLEIARHFKPSFANDYANKTMAYNTYEAMHYSGTDLGNLLAVLNNPSAFNKSQSKVSIPLFQINRYLQAAKGSSFESHSDDVTFFWRLEDYLKLYSNSNYRILRRDVGNWKDLSYAEKSRVQLVLRQEFDRRSSSCDIYLWFKQEFRLKESIGESISSKLDYHDKLNPDLWYNEELVPDVKEALGRIANKFSEFIDVKQIKIIDYVLTGSNCAFNYTEDSDVDIHVIVDASALGDNPLTSPFLLAKKALWNSGHDITVKGYDVEIYAEDINDKENQLVATGIYSLLHDKWIKKPQHVPITWDDAAVVSKAEDIMNQIDTMISMGEPDLAEITRLWEHIYKMRRAGLAKGGEFDCSNLAFKTVRNHGYLDKLRKFERMREDDDLTLEHSTGLQVVESILKSRLAK